MLTAVLGHLANAAAAAGQTYVSSTDVAHTASTITDIAATPWVNAHKHKDINEAYDAINTASSKRGTLPRSSQAATVLHESLKRHLTMFAERRARNVGLRGGGHSES